MKCFAQISMRCFSIPAQRRVSGLVQKETFHSTATPQVLEMDDCVRLAFCARADIRAGQELTYDYRFKEEGNDDKVACSCGRPHAGGP